MYQRSGHYLVRASLQLVFLIKNLLPTLKKIILLFTFLSYTMSITVFRVCRTETKNINKLIFFLIFIYYNFTVEHFFKMGAKKWLSFFFLKSSIQVKLLLNLLNPSYPPTLKFTRFRNILVFLNLENLRGIGHGVFPLKISWIGPCKKNSLTLYHIN